MTYREGYFKSQEEQDTATGKLFMAYVNEEQNLALIEAGLDHLATDLEQLAKRIRTNPLETKVSEFNVTKIVQSIQDWKESKTELERLTKAVNNVGLGRYIDKEKQ